MNKMNFYNKERNKSTLDSLTKALANRDKSVINTGSVIAPQKSAQEDNILSGASGLLTGGANFYGNLKNSDLLGGNSSDGLGIIGNTANDYISGKGGESLGTFGDAANSYIGGGDLGTGSAIGDAIGAEAGGFSMPAGGWLSLGTGVLNGLNKGFNHSDDKEILGGFGNGVQGFFNINENDSDVMQGINGTLDGAMKGTMIFPGVGTAIGALLGLGSSFLDDI